MRPPGTSLHAAEGRQQQDKRQEEQRWEATAEEAPPITMTTIEGEEDTGMLVLLRSELKSVAVETEQLKVEIERVKCVLFGEGETRYLGGKGDTGGGGGGGK